MAKPWIELTIDEKQERFISSLVDLGEDMRDHIYMMNNQYARDIHRGIVPLQKELVRSLDMIARIEHDYFTGVG